MSSTINRESARQIVLVNGGEKTPSNPGEIWKPIPEFPGYEASNQGRIRSVDRRIRCENRLGQLEWRLYRGRILSPSVTSTGYPHVQIGKGGYNYSGEDVHKLVMLAFVGPCPEDHEIGHRDGNPANAYLTNLRYVTYAENYQDQILHGRAHRGEKHYAAKLTESDVLEIRKSKQSNGTLRCKSNDDFRHKIRKELGMAQ